MKPTHKQSQIIAFLRSRGGYAITREIVAEFGSNYFGHPELYIGQILARMVAAGHLVREKKGVYRLPSAADAKMAKYNATEIDNQTTLF